MEFDGTEYNEEYFNPQPKIKAIRLKGKPKKRLQEEVLLRDAYQCQTCGEATHAPPHHVVAVGQGGSDIAGNMVAECNVCHYDIHHRSATYVLTRIEHHYGVKNILKYFLLGVVSEKEV